MSYTKSPLIKHIQDPIDVHFYKAMESMGKKAAKSGKTTNEDSSDLEDSDTVVNNPKKLYRKHTIDGKMMNSKAAKTRRKDFKLLKKKLEPLQISTMMKLGHMKFFALPDEIHIE